MIRRVQIGLNEGDVRGKRAAAGVTVPEEAKGEERLLGIQKIK